MNPPERNTISDDSLSFFEPFSSHSAQPESEAAESRELTPKPDPPGVWAGIRREVLATARAFAQPVREQRRYRSRLRLLELLLRDPHGYGDAERAMALASVLLPGSRPSIALLGEVRIGVVVHEETPATDLLPTPWVLDLVEPRLWWIERAELGVMPPEQGAPLLACVGISGDKAVLLDLFAGPDTVSVLGVPRTASAVIQALAAQLDVRLPAGAVRVGAGVHASYAGTADDEEYDVGVLFAVVHGAAAVPAVPVGVRVLHPGAAEGSSRVLTAGRDGYLAIDRVPLSISVDVLPLTHALVRTLHLVPPWPAPEFAGVAPVPSRGSGVPDEWAAEPESLGAELRAAALESALPSHGAGIPEAGVPSSEGPARRPVPLAPWADESS